MNSETCNFWSQVLEDGPVSIAFAYRGANLCMDIRARMIF